MLVSCCCLQAPGFADRTGEFGLSVSSNAACWIDIDRDGWTDLCAGGAVWKNDQGNGFSRIANVGSVVAADFDNDGYPDLFSWSSMQLFHNEQGKSFAEVPLPELPPTVSLGACWGDFDNDGFVDLCIGGYESSDPEVFCPTMILMNRNGKGFELVFSQKSLRTRGVTACDFDGDGDLDIYLSNYRLRPNSLWTNDGQGRFQDLGPEQNAVATSPGFAGGHSIGAAWGDFDNDGRIDLFAGNFAHVDRRGDQPKSRFLRNSGLAGKQVFEDRGTCGVFYQESYASPAAADFDNDGDLDLYFTTVYGTASFNKENFPVLFCNDGEFTFTDATALAGLARLPATYQAAWSDFDHDGDLDLVTAGRLYENRSQPGNWIGILLEGDGKTVNRSAIGAQVRIRLGDRTLTRQVEAGTGQGNQNDLAIHFGLGEWDSPLDLEILWPGGKTQKHVNIVPGQRIKLGLGE